MVDATLVPAVREAIKQNEIGNGSPYQLSYARLGESGASFGVFQGDVHANGKARATLTQVLQAAGLAADAVNRIVAGASQPCPNGSRLSAADDAAADGALGSPAGRAIVDAMDAGLLAVVLAGLDSSIAAAATRGLTIEPAALLYIALWVNMTGAPTTLNKWLAGTTELGVAPPDGPAVSTQEVEAYLHATTYFTQHAKNFAHLQESVGAATGLLA